VKAVLGPALLVVGALIMVGGLFAIHQTGGLKGNLLTPGGWFAVTLIGVVFVTCQAVGSAMMFSSVDPRLATPRSRMKQAQPEASEPSQTSESKDL
jgi:hypothetical protein